MSAKEFSFTDNNDGTITRTIDDNKYVYNILVDNNIPEDESIIDYSYYQHEENLVKNLNEAGIGEWSFCSGTCVAMVLAIKYGDKNIKPEDVIYFNEDKEGSNDDEVKKEINWTWYTDDKGNTYENGLKDWEKDKDTKNDGGQVYDNRYLDKNTQTYHYDSVNGEIKNDEDYLKEIKSNLKIGQPIIIHVNNHFVVVVGVEASVSLDDATLEQLVIFDPATKNEHKIATLGNAYNEYKIKDYRMIMPYLIDENKEIVRDENKMPTINPYYLDPYKYSNGEIMPYKEYNAVKSIIENDIYDQSEKERIVRFIISNISHQKISDEEYLNIKKCVKLRIL